MGGDFFFQQSEEGDGLGLGVALGPVGVFVLDAQGAEGGDFGGEHAFQFVFGRGAAGARLSFRKMSDCGRNRACLGDIDSF